jgi:hypothetical protein
MADAEKPDALYPVQSLMKAYMEVKDRYTGIKRQEGSGVVGTWGPSFSFWDPEMYDIRCCVDAGGRR